jgi:cyclopropane fatty-acyl-phospholipid synthase-like methyltransferase
MVNPHGEAAQRWADALARWSIPREILAAAPDKPWHCPVALFAADSTRVADPSRPSHRLARAALGGGGTVLDVGCGGGAASVPLVPPARRVTGVDASPQLLAAFADAATAAGAEVDLREGRWPEAAATVAPADVVVCHHVAYNAPDIGAFTAALDGHARRLVVMEVTERHPQSWLNPLWKRFWGLDRPTEPSADLLVEVVRQAGARPSVHRFRRPHRQRTARPEDWVAFARRQLCLPEERDGEVAVALRDLTAADRDYVAVAWRPTGGRWSPAG